MSIRNLIKHFIYNFRQLQNLCSRLLSMATSAPCTMVTMALCAWRYSILSTATFSTKFSTPGRNPSSVSPQTFPKRTSPRAFALRTRTRNSYLDVRASSADTLMLLRRRVRVRLQRRRSSLTPRIKPPGRWPRPNEPPCASPSAPNIFSSRICIIETTFCGAALFISDLSNSAREIRS